MNPVVEAWIVIEKLAALVATQGVSEDVKKSANEQIDKLLKDVVSPSLSELAAKSAGLLIRWHEKNKPLQSGFGSSARTT